MSKLNRTSLFVATGGLAAVLALATIRNSANAQVPAAPPAAAPAATPAATPPAAPVVPADTNPLPAPLAGPVLPAKVAYVNLGKIFSHNDQFKAVQAKLQQEAQNIQVTAAANKIALDKLVDARKQVAPGSPEYKAKTAELEKTSLQLQMNQKLDEVNLQREQSESIKEMYDSISAAVKVVSTAKGIDLVLVDNGDDLPADAGERTVENLEQVIASHQILYASAKIDITGDVALQLAAAAKAAPAPAH